MCQRVDAEVIIGNVLITAVERQQFEISLDYFTDFDKEVTILLKKRKTITSFSTFELLEFENNYPYFIDDFSNDTIKLKSYESDKDFRNRLVNNFRAGLPSYLVEDMMEALDTVFNR